MTDATLRTTLDAFLEALAALPELPEMETARVELTALADRAIAKPRELTYALVFGPTGCGKSKLANSVFGRLLTPVGYRRPTTSRPYVIISAAAARAVIESLPLVPFEAIEIEGDAFARLALVDSPDIDGLHPEHQAIADQFLRLSDAALVVLDPSKYGDESIWRYLRRFRREGYPFRIVLNKASDPAALDDLAAKLGEEGIESAPIAIPREPSRDNDLLSEGEGLREVRAVLSAWADSEQMRRDGVRRGIRSAMALVRGAAMPRIEERREELARLLADMGERVGRKREELRRGLPFAVDKETLLEMSRRLLARLERIDPFRLPRRILSYPFRLLREKFGLRLPETEQDEELQELWNVREESFSAAASELVDALDDALRRHGVVVPEESTEASAREAFRALHAEFEGWVKEQAAKIAGTLTVGQRVRFYVAQALVIGGIIGVEVHTGGVLTMTELVTGGVVSPVAAKLIGMALSAEESRKFQEKVRGEYLTRAEGLFEGFAAPALGRLREQLEACEEALRRGAELVCALEALGGADGIEGRGT